MSASDELIAIIRQVERENGGYLSDEVRELLDQEVAAAEQRWRDLDRFAEIVRES